MAAPTVIEPKSQDAVLYDFSRPDAVSGDHLRAMKSVHENFVRMLGSSLSAYLRTFVSVSLVRIEQLSFADFSRNAPSPATTVPLRVLTHESRAILQMSHSALFPILEMLLGGTAKPVANIDRKITEIEASILDPVLRIFVQELKMAWHPISPVSFVIEQEAAAPHILASIAPNEGLVAIAVEIRLFEVAGIFTLGFPSRVIRALLQSSHASKPEPSGADRSKILRLIERAELEASVRLNGPQMLFRDLLSLEAGDVIAFDHPLNQEIELELNGAPKFRGHVVARGAKRAFQVKRKCQRARSADESSRQEAK